MKLRRIKRIKSGEVVLILENLVGNFANGEDTIGVDQEK